MVGSAAAATTYLLAAYDAAVTFIAGDLGCVERVESRMAAEALSSMFESYVTQLDPALPEFLGFLRRGYRYAGSERPARSQEGCRSELVQRPSRTEPTRRSPRLASHLQGDCA